MQDEQIKAVLTKIIETIDLLAEETAELVDKFHSPNLTAAGRQDLYETRVHGLTEAARNMRQAASTLLGIPDRQASQGGSK